MKTNPERDPVKEGNIATLQWHSHYWGPWGAIAQGEQYYSKFLFTDNPQTRLWAVMALASIYYSAASSAATIFKHFKVRSKLNVFGMIKWAWTSYCLLKKAWLHAQSAHLLIQQTENIEVSSSDYDVLQSIARKYYRILWNRPHGRAAQVVLTLAEDSIRRALADPNCANISKCLLRIGRADLLSLQAGPKSQGQIRIAIFDTLLEVWDVAMRITATDTDLQMRRQLSRVFRHIKEISERLIPFHKELMIPQHQLYPSSATELHKQADLLMLKYLGLGESSDQESKAGMTLSLPAQSTPPPHRPTT